MLDVEAHASTGSADPVPRGSARVAWGREHRLLLTAGAFAFAVFLGVLIGLFTAPDDHHSVRAVAPERVVVPQLRPPVQPASWDHRQPGRAHQVLVRLEPDPAALRLALRWSLADYLRAQPGGSTVTVDNLSIPDNKLFYGAIEGRDTASDTYWAVGPVEVGGAAPTVTGPHVWRRVGDGPWEVAASGPGACSQIPGQLIDMWRGFPATCART
jgi:hypothetical protein